MGLLSRDNIVEINGETVTKDGDLTMQLWSYFDKAPASLTVEREDKRVTLVVKKTK